MASALHGRIGLMMALAVGASISASAQTPTTYHGRRAWRATNGAVELIVTPGGGHIASLALTSGPAKGLNPFWLPPWQSVEPGRWQRNPADFGGTPAAQLLSSILGHNICVDFFGAPSKPEIAAGVPVHGEAPCVDWTLRRSGRGAFTYETRLPLADMKVSRTIRMAPGSSAIWITETVQNNSAFDRPFGWQQHPSFGPPFLEKGATFFDMPGTKSKVYPGEFSKQERLKRGEEFEWPDAPGTNGDTINLRPFPGTEKANSDFTTTLIDPSRQWAFVTAVNTRRNLVVGYVWPRKDWPWVGSWEENHSRSGKPWLGRAVVRGMEFGTSPFPDSRRDAVTLASLFDTPTYRWISAKQSQTIGYGAFVAAVPKGTTGVKDVVVKGSTIQISLEGVDKTITLKVNR
jgi:hypothetical protein